MIFNKIYKLLYFYHFAAIFFICRSTLELRTALVFNLDSGPNCYLFLTMMTNQQILMVKDIKTL